MAATTFRVLPGFRLTLGYTLAYLSLIVLVPLAAVFLKTASIGFAEFWQVVTAPRVVASYKLSFGMSLAAAIINAVFGLMLAWVLVRYRFPAKRLIDALVDLPFALPTRRVVAPVQLGQLWKEPDGSTSLALHRLYRNLSVIGSIFGGEANHKAPIHRLTHGQDWKM